MNFLAWVSLGALSLVASGSGPRLPTVPAVDWGEAALGTVVVFLSSRCPCSKGHEARLAQLAHEFTPKGFRFLGIHSNQDEDPISAGEYFQRQKFPFPIFGDPGAKMADRLGALKTPHAFLVNLSGEILFQGGIDDSQDPARAKRFFLDEALTAWSRGQKPEPSRVRALGCSIRR